MELTEKELDQILKKLPAYWKEVGEKKFTEDAYRYLMKHTELLVSDEVKEVYEYLGNRVVQIWCKETSTEDEAWMRKFIEMIFRGQNKTTPSLAERGKTYAEYLIRLFEKHPEVAKKMIEAKKS